METANGNPRRMRIDQKIARFMGSFAAPAWRADTINQSALSPCSTTAFWPFSANPPASHRKPFHRLSS